MKKNRQMYNQEINRLYRQLGKELFFDEREELPFSRKQRKLIKSIQKNIQKIEKLKDHDISVSTEALILEPEKNNDGFYEYVFCPQCQAGNNPKSTHCIRCNQPL
ncbi:hypothetical protein QBE53_10635 [Vallitaleaceae bacterium 9-2]